MAYVKAATSMRARQFLATAEGRRTLLRVYLNAANDRRPQAGIEATWERLARDWKSDRKK